MQLFVYLLPVFVILTIATFGDGAGSCDGVRYDNKCFIAVALEIDAHQAVAECKLRGGYVANLYSKSHMDAVMNYIRKQEWFDERKEFFRTGLNIDPQTKKLTLRDGTDAPDGLKWSADYPRGGRGYGAYTNVILIVSSDPYYIWQYLGNDTPTSKFNVLCEIE